MELFIIRHGLAGDHDPVKYPNDDFRPLTDEGRERFAATVAALAKRGFAPMVIATSPLVRCRQTADLAAKGLGGKPAVVEVDALRPGSDLTELLTWTGDQQHESIAWCGHVPDVNLLASAMIGDGSASVRFKKGAIACIRFEDQIHRGRGELLWLATAKVLGC